MAWNIAEGKCQLPKVVIRAKVSAPFRFQRNKELEKFFFAFSAEEETKINECGILPLFSPNLTAVTSSEWQQKKRSQWLAFNFGFYVGLVVRAIAAQRRGRGFDATKYFSLITCFSSMLCFSLLRIKIIFFEGMMNSLKSIAIKEKYNAMTLETLLYL